MAIRFTCERCGHAIEVDDRFAGKHGHCKHCGHATEVPAAGHGATAAGLTLRPVEVDQAAAVDAEMPGPGLKVRPVETGAEAPALPSHLNADDLDDADRPEPRPRWWGRLAGNTGGLYAVLDPEGRDAAQAKRVHLGPHYDTRLARFVASVLRWARDWLYVASIGFLALAAVAFAFKLRVLLHLGAAGVIAANVGMLAVGLFYMVVLPFRDGLPAGLAALLFPPYTVYYWVTRWPAMKKPVVNTLKAFVPLLAVGLAYAFYEEAPAIEAEVQKAEQAIEAEGRALESKLPAVGPGTGTDGGDAPAPASAPEPSPAPAGRGPAPF